MSKIRENLQASGIEYLSFSSMKELRNNEMMFFKKYINYEFDNNLWLSTIIGKSCHHALEVFLQDQEMRKGLEKEPKTFMEAVEKIAKDYAKDDYINKNQKHEDFWNSKTMIEYGGFTDLVKLVDDYKKLADEIKEMGKDVSEEKAQELEKVGEKIKKSIDKHRKKDEKLDAFINWGAKGSVNTIFDGIKFGLNNFFTTVYPKIKNWKLVATEYNQTMDVCDLDGVVLDLPLKFIIDALFEDENGDLIIVDWKFKGQLSDDESIKPDYDMQGETYFFGCFTAFGKKPKKALFIEIQPADAKPPYMQQAELRELCGANGIDWEKGNNGKYMTNALMQDALMEKGVIELKPVVYEYIIDFENQAYLHDMWLVFYRQTIKRLYQLLVQEDEFVPNIFDQSFDGGITVYQEWMAQFKPKDAPEYTDDDAVDL